MNTRENTGKIMLDALQYRRVVLLEIVKELDKRLADLQGIVDDRTQLLFDIQSIDDEISAVSLDKKIPVVLEALPR